MKFSFSLPHLSQHSYYLIGSDVLRVELKNTLENNHGISVKANPDFHESFYENFVIDDARKLKELHGIRPVQENRKKIFIISMNGITIEAQNALLKLLEEPADYAYFFLIIPSAHLLIPTVKSRLSEIEISISENKRSTSEDGNNFLKLSIAKRLDVIKKLTEEISKEKKTKQDAINFLNEIEQALYSKGITSDTLKSLETLSMSRKYINDRAPSLKILLESVALSCSTL